MMFSKNLRYYRLKRSMSMKKLADEAGLSHMAVSNYERGKRTPDIETIKRLAEVLNVRVSDFLAPRNTALVFQHGEFRKAASLQVGKQDYIRESVEEYFSRFFTVVEMLGGEVLPEPPACHALKMTGDAETDAHAMRLHLDLGGEGPVRDLIGTLENKGILIYVLEVDSKKFSGMNGFVNERPYIVINGNMNPERERSTIAHELAHLLFSWPEDMDEGKIEQAATAISGAFLFPREDAIRELGIRRAAVSQDMTMVCRKYGISMMLLAVRARQAGIITKSAYEIFFKTASKRGWRTEEPSRIERECPTLFEQLVYRAVNEDEISVQKGAEMLQVPYTEIVSKCCFGGNEG